MIDESSLINRLVNYLIRNCG